MTAVAGLGLLRVGLCSAHKPSGPQMSLTHIDGDPVVDKH
jgi:hypothetical protein